MSYTAIQVENIGKQYQIGELLGGQATFRERLMQRLTDPFAFKHKNQAETFWALKDVNFSIEDGEVVGIIGRNGAGKSTLLKILSRITDPTEGRIRMRGRVGTLLEVGTGFHPELTGRENTYMNGAILGMSRREIERKFDEIVDFSGIERFIDTPVKRYSSGMYVRLAFAVAAHLETDILLVDEVLAVGDIAFQQKCLGKMSDVANAGRTVIFISHNMVAVQDLCPRTVWLSDGQVVADGNTSTVLADYVASLRTATDSSDLENVERPLEVFGQNVRILSVNAYNTRQQLTHNFMRGEAIEVEITCRILEAVKDATFIVGIDNLYNQRLLTITGFENHKLFDAEAGDIVTGRVWIEGITLMPGRYYISPAVMSRGRGHDFLINVATLDISEISASENIVGQMQAGYFQLSNPKWDIATHTASAAPLIADTTEKG